MSEQPAVYGLVLTGGKSSRMGSPKGLIEYHGMPQQAYMFRLLHGLCDNVYTSCKSVADLPHALHPLADRFELEGPLNGVLTAFQQHPAVAWLTAPVDMPHIDAAILKFLLSHRDKQKLATCFFDSDGKHPEPLLTLWEPAAGPFLTAYFESGRYGIRFFLESHPVHIIPAPDPSVHLNINSPEELQRWRQQQAGAS